MPTFSPTKLAQWSGGTWVPTCPESIEGASTDSRTIARGNIYFALKGKNFEGHNFINAAFEKGASGAVANKDWTGAVDKKRPMLRVSDTGKALRDVAAGYRRDVGAEIIAVTGSVGKTTVKEMTARVLSSVTKTASTRGNWNNAIGLPLSLLSMEKSAKVGVFELGMNQPGEIADLCGILVPDWGVITNAGPVHIEFFRSVDAIAREKADLLKSLPKKGVAVLCSDGEFFDLFKSMAPSRLITISANGDADYFCLKRDLKKKEVMISERETGEKFLFRAALPGAHNVMNAMFAIAVGRAHGADWSQIQVALESYVSPPMRWEQKEIREIKVINDAYNANPLSMRVAIQTFGEEVTAGGKWLVVAGMLELGDREMEEHIALGKFIGSGNWDGLVVVGRMGQDIAKGAESSGFKKDRLFCCETNAEAAALIKEKVKRGDAILVKASRGMHLEEIVESL